MFGFGAEKKQSAHLAGIIFGLNQRFAQEVGVSSVAHGVKAPTYNERNLAIIFGFACAGAQHMNASSKILEKALEMYFGNMSDGKQQLSQLSLIVEDPKYEKIIIAATQAGHEISTRNDLSSLRRLADSFVKNSF